MRKYHKDGTRPDGDEVFVFGSNLAGIHGAGAARAALLYFGAQYGEGEGYQRSKQGKHCYAIPTKDLKIDTLPIQTISLHVDDFAYFTHDHPEMQFFVTAVGCGLAGYKHEDIAPLFRNCAGNCSFPEEWEPYLEFMK